MAYDRDESFSDGVRDDSVYDENGDNIANNNANVNSVKQAMSLGKKIGCGCALIFVLSLGGCGAIFASVFWFMQQSDAYTFAIETAQNDQRVQNMLGTPIEAGWFVSGNINITNDTGDANLEIPISGPKGSGTVYVIGTRSGGVWTFTRLTCELDGNDHPINLLQQDGISD
ncbi:MAG: hypothetical protein HRU15_00330 [Planctomycetes bacterium]|nr:hypothetical protein [Planctomycetota bacterium]